MDCHRIRELMAAVMEGCASPDEARQVETHLERCAKCRAESQLIAGLRRRLANLGFAAPGVDLRDRVMARIAARPQALPTRGFRGISGPWLERLTSRGLRLAAAGLAALPGVLAEGMGIGDRAVPV